MASGWLGWDWGSVPTWVGTVITSGSAFIAALSYRRSVRDKEREQASKVGTWVGTTELDGETKSVLRVANNSDSPIYEVSVRRSGDLELISYEIPAATAAMTPVSSSSTTSVRRERSAGVKLWIISLEATEVTEFIPDERPPDVQFRDALGRWWLRRSDGRLDPVQGESIRQFRHVETKVHVPFAWISRRQDEAPANREEPSA